MNTNYFRTPLGIPAESAATSQRLCAGDAPLLLLPVRLETRFFPRDGTTVELRIRVYPDKLQINSHEATLLQAEIDAGQAYWREDWRCAEDHDRRKLAWCALADRFGAERAAWIMQALRPTNAAQRPVVPSAPGQAANPTPSFPALQPAAADAVGWQRAPLAQLLPDRWIACVHAAGGVVQVASGSPIVRPLAVGPDPAAAAPDTVADASLLAGEDMAVDAGMRWMVDFDAAESVGMALRVVLPQPVAAAGLDSVVVFGLAQALPVEQAGAAVADLLEGHRYTDGLAFLAAGTPTNNTQLQRSEHSSRDPEHEKSFAAEVLAGSTAPAPGSNATALGRVLGFDAERTGRALGSLSLARGTHGPDQHSMNTALWQVGWGYFLSNMIGPHAGLLVSDLDWVRHHFIHHVRAGGLLAPLRAGRQPYGILPVTSIDAWAPDAGASDQAPESKLRDLLVALRDEIWRPAVGLAPRIGLRQPPLADPDADLVDVMGMDAVSHRFRLRAALGRHFAEHLLLMANKAPGGTLPGRSELMARAQSLLERLGLPATPDRLPRLASILFEGQARAVLVPAVQPGQAAAALQPNYIAAMLGDRRLQALLDAVPTANTSVLQALLRHAALREIAAATAQIAAQLPGLDAPTLVYERELVDLVDAAPTDFIFGPPPKTEHWRRQLQRVVPAVTGTATIEQHLQTSPADPHPATRHLAEFYGALDHLKSLPVDVLETLLHGTLDLGGHRLDAWITSLANKRLVSMSQTGRGLRVGAYGWVENLRPDDAPALIAPGALPDGEPGPLHTARNDGGFIHAPSLTHAAAAALLRNAHLGPTGQPPAADPFAIDLSSRRARKANQILRAVQRGQPLGALLGYDFERRLGELGLGGFIQAFRALSPRAPTRLGDAGSGQADTQGVVDGLTLLRRYEDPADTAVAGILAAATPAQREQLALAFAALGDAVDGLADALTAETAFQLARGNSARVASTLEAISRGESNPGQLDVLQTPRTGTAATHRVVCLMSGGPQTAPGWAAASASPAASVERMLNAWVSRLLWDPRLTRVTAQAVDPDNGQVIGTRSFAASELGLTALDFVLAVPAQASQAHEASRVERLARYHAERLLGLTAGAQIRLSSGRPADLAPTEVTLSDMIEQARAIRRLLDSARALRPQDLLAGQGAGRASPDLGDLEARVVAAENALVAARKRLADQVAPAATPSCESLRTAILSVGAWTLDNTIPESAHGESPQALEALRSQAKALVSACSARVDAGASVRSRPVSDDAAARLAHLTERARAAFGGGFLMLPRIVLDPAVALELQTALAAGPALLGQDTAAPYTWFARHARVREPVAALATCLRNGEVLGTAERLSLRLAQLPGRANERWVGLPQLPGTEFPHDKLSLMVQSVAAIVTTQPLCGLWVDEWVEIIPSASETTAVAFQHDPPNAMAPQCALLAVPPVPGQDWTVESLRRVLLETLDLAKLRAVEPGLLGSVAQYLPANYVALNAADDAASTHLMPTTASA
jgi:hypothetical protein